MEMEVEVEGGGEVWGGFGREVWSRSRRWVIKIFVTSTLCAL